MKKYLLATSLAFAISATLHGQNTQEPAAQEASATTQDLLELSLDDLMNVNMVSASRSEEKAFEAPLSSFVITKGEIENSGSTSIPEALRLCPGLFVRQTANGVYDVSIRGLDNLPTHQYINTNKVLLVMIDNRPVFGYLYGGTNWQNLPVEIIDVERIEVVLGPSSPLYGPNAVTGVVNIITRNITKDGVSASANGQADVTGSYIGQAFLGYQVNDKFDISGSFNFTKRNRQSQDFFDPATGKFVEDLNDHSNPVFRDTANQKAAFPYSGFSLDQMSGNISASYTPAEDVKINAGGGFNNNSSLFPAGLYTGNSYYDNNSIYGILRGEVKNFTVLASVLNGKNTSFGNIRPTVYDYRNIDGYLDYKIKISEKFNIRPAVSFQQAYVNDEKYVAQGYFPVFNQKDVMTNIAGSLKADYSVGKFRLIGAVRGDKFTYPDKIYFSYQGVVNYKLNEKNILRAVAARSNSGSFMMETFINLKYQEIPAMPPYMPFKTEVYVNGAKDRKLIVNNLYELGYRSQLMKNLQMDVAAFLQQSSGYSAFVMQAPVVEPSNGRIVINSTISNLDLKAVQTGLTLAFNYAAFENKFNFKPFVTVQQTKLYNYSPYYETPGSAAATGHTGFDTETQTDKKSKGTPGAFGGFYTNYAMKKFNFNVTGYYMGKHEVYPSFSENTARPYAVYDANYIKAKFILNAKVSYKVFKYLSVYVNGRNFAGVNSREYFAGDKIGAMLLGGISFNY
jgi:iron complex outermembrane recepter protein